MVFHMHDTFNRKYQNKNRFSLHFHAVNNSNFKVLKFDTSIKINIYSNSRKEYCSTTIKNEINVDRCK